MPDQSISTASATTVGRDAAGQPVERGYLIYLLVVATGGWAMAAYDFNLQVMALSDIAKGLHLSSTQVGLFGFFVDFAELAFSLFFGRFMDRRSRRLAWIVALAGTTVFTGLTYFVRNYWQLCVVRALASGLAYTELAISITLVNESLPSRRRGIYYSIVQAGWPIGVTLAAIIYLVTIQLGWHFLFVFGVAPFAAVVVGRVWIKEPERFRRIKEIRTACQSGDEQKAERLSDEYDIPVDQARTHSFSELFGKDIRRQTILLMVVFFFYGASYVASNLYIVYWLTHYNGYSNRAAVFLLLACGAIGFWFYIVGGLLGERVSRRRILFWTAVCVPVSTLAFMWIHSLVWSALVYFFVYQATNGTWSGAGYTYIAESFPTRLRGTGVGFLDAVMVSGYVLGAAIWTGLIHHVSPELVWGIIAVALSCGQLAIWFARDIDPKESLQ